MKVLALIILIAFSIPQAPAGNEIVNNEACITGAPLEARIFDAFTKNGAMECIEKHKRKKSNVLEDGPAICNCFGNTWSGYVNHIDGRIVTKAISLEEANQAAIVVQSKRNDETVTLSQVKAAIAYQKMDSQILKNLLKEDQPKGKIRRFFKKMKRKMERVKGSAEATGVARMWSGANACKFEIDDINEFRALPSQKQAIELSRLKEQDIKNWKADTVPESFQKYLNHNQDIKLLLVNLKPNDALEFRKNFALNIASLMKASPALYGADGAWKEINDSLEKGALSKLVDKYTEKANFSDFEEKINDYFKIQDLGTAQLLNKDLWKQSGWIMEKSYGIRDLPHITDCYNNQYMSETEETKCKMSVGFYCAVSSQDNKHPSWKTVKKLINKDMSETAEFDSGLRVNEKLYDKLGNIMCKGPQKLVGLVDSKGKLVPSNLSFVEFKNKLCKGQIKVKGQEDFKCMSDLSARDPRLNHLYLSLLDVDSLNLKDGVFLTEEVLDYIAYSKENFNRRNIGPTASEILDDIRQSSSPRAAGSLSETILERVSTARKLNSIPSNEQLPEPTVASASSASASPSAVPSTSSSPQGTTPPATFNGQMYPSAMSAPQLQERLQDERDEREDLNEELLDLNRKLPQISDRSEYATAEGRITKLENEMLAKDKTIQELEDRLEQAEAEARLAKLKEDSNRFHGTSAEPLDQNKSNVSGKMAGQSVEEGGQTSGGSSSLGLSGLGSASNVLPAVMNGAGNSVSRVDRSPAAMAKLNMNSALLAKYGISATDVKDASKDGLIVALETDKAASTAKLSKDVQGDVLPIKGDSEVYQGFLKNDTSIMKKYEQQVISRPGKVVRLSISAEGKIPFEVFAIKDNGKIIFVKRSAVLQNLKNELQNF